MGTEEDQQKQIDLLQHIYNALKTTEKREPVDQTYWISTGKPLVIDYKERRHLFIWSANALMLTVEDLGIITVPINTWVNIGYQQSMRLVPTAQLSTVPVFVRATDETTP